MTNVLRVAPTALREERLAALVALLGEDIVVTDTNDAPEAELIELVRAARPDVVVLDAAPGVRAEAVRDATGALVLRPHRVRERDHHGIERCRFDGYDAVESAPIEEATPIEGDGEPVPT